MTTHGARIRDVWLAIESIARGTVRPGRIILWLNEPAHRVPWRLRRLQRRGLEVIFTPSGLAVHTKYWPYVSSQQLDRPLVLSDDDIVYPPRWLEGLREQFIATGGRHVVAYRAHVVGMTSPDEFTPYATWTPCRSDEPRYTHLATSVSGQILPPSLQTALLAAGTEFLMLAPTNDDIWLHRCGVLAGIPTQQVTEHQQHWYFTPGSQTSGLNLVNVAGGANDVQMATAHNSQTRERIWQASIASTTSSTEDAAN
ncbi:hypothetical protein [Microbacterium sp. SS28]|uniref:hypothetical protein n=1 Tax=Microbacterium sp. SS28 TaxID=2919948 RepID=UPI001FA995AC|nr:hypothetical protein [Microbacterium sp. SS28]